MNGYENIETAARHKDWQECARIMFGLLYRCKTEGQRNVARAALYPYVKIWRAKHQDSLKQIPDRLLENDINTRRPKLPELPEDLDPADAEFENGLIEFYNGAYFSGSHSQHTMHFATAIRSAVTARQIDKWLHDHPDDYSRWKSGHGIDGPTFLDDGAAANEARIAWRFVDHLLKRQPMIARGSARLSKQIAQSYKRWEDTVL